MERQRNTGQVDPFVRPSKPGVVNVSRKIIYMFMDAPIHILLNVITNLMAFYNISELSHTLLKSGELNPARYRMMVYQRWY